MTPPRLRLRVGLGDLRVQDGRSGRGRHGRPVHDVQQLEHRRRVDGGEPAVDRLLRRQRVVLLGSIDGAAAGGEPAVDHRVQTRRRASGVEQVDRVERSRLRSGCDRRQRRGVQQQEAGAARLRRHRADPHEDRDRHGGDPVGERDARLPERAGGIELQHHRRVRRFRGIQRVVHERDQRAVERALDLHDVHARRRGRGCGRRRAGGVGRQQRQGERQQEDGRAARGHGRFHGTERVGVSSRKIPDAYLPTRAPPGATTRLQRPMGLQAGRLLVAGSRRRRRRRPDRLRDLSALPRPGLRHPEDRSAAAGRRAPPSRGSRRSRSDPRSTRATARRSSRTSTWTTARSSR